MMVTLRVFVTRAEHIVIFNDRLQVLMRFQCYSPMNVDQPRACSPAAYCGHNVGYCRLPNTVAYHCQLGLAITRLSVDCLQYLGVEPQHILYVNIFSLSSVPQHLVISFKCSLIISNSSLCSTSDWGEFMTGVMRCTIMC